MNQETMNLHSACSKGSSDIPRNREIHRSSVLDYENRGGQWKPLVCQSSYPVKKIAVGSPSTGIPMLEKKLGPVKVLEDQ